METITAYWGYIGIMDNKMECDLQTRVKVGGCRPDFLLWGSGVQCKIAFVPRSRGFRSAVTLLVTLLMNAMCTTFLVRIPVTRIG